MLILTWFYCHLDPHFDPDWSWFHVFFSRIWPQIWQNTDTDMPVQWKAPPLFVFTVSGERKVTVKVSFLWLAAPTTSTDFFFFSSFNQRIWGKQSWVWRYLKVRGRKKEPILRNLSQTKQIISATVSLPYFSGGKKVCKVSFYEVLSAIVCVSPLRNHIWPVKLHFYHVQSKVPWI